MADPKYFVVVDYHEFDLDKFNLRKYGRITRLHCVQFTVRELNNPLISPICVYYENGVRRYLWKDKCYMELNIPYDWFKRELDNLIKIVIDDVTVIGFKSILTFMERYKLSAGPTELDDINTVDLRSYEKTFHRILYEIDQK